ncbi:hypothetical protein [Desulfovibrio inopinatus]|uniref:hypothetical protein n=1 Tax=Desulfovibrio inopinatus TaxID=102109 RepID=UPI00041F1CE1|nr:hypothetical protein [Desulfovibrio inopinatus]
MLAYIGLDDTDVVGAAMGTGRLARTFAAQLPEGVSVWGIIRHQLPRLEGVPYTSNNSSACIVVEYNDPAELDETKQRAVDHILAHASLGSDPGLCVAPAGAVNTDLINFGMVCSGKIVNQADAMQAAKQVYLEGLGGTNDGIIGASAAVGLTAHGWCGRFIEYGRLRSLGTDVLVQELWETGIRVVSIDRDPAVPLPDDMVFTNGWLRPSLWAGVPVLQVKAAENGGWVTAHGKRKKAHPKSNAA